MGIKFKHLTIAGKGILYVIFATNIIALILLFLSTRAQSIPPSQFMIISFLGMGFPVLLLINIIYIVVWIVLLRWKFVIVGLLGLAVNWSAISIYVPLHSKNKEIPESCLKFMTYNVRGFNWLTGDEARSNPILEYIAGSGADIICLQEFAVEENKNSRKIISLAEFDDVMEDYPYRTIIRLGDTDDSCIYGLACYSKYPILKVARVPVESAFNGSAMYEIKIGRKTITIVNNHLETNHITSEDKQLYKELVVQKSREKLDEVAYSVQQRLAPAFFTREKQANIIHACIEKQRPNTNAMIVCGDFNDPPMSYAYSKIRGDLVDSFNATGKGMGITYHENGFFFRIDYIMHTPNIKSYNSYIDKVKYSDHYPLYSYLFVDYI